MTPDGQGSPMLDKTACKTIRLGFGPVQGRHSCTPSRSLSPGASHHRLSRSCYELSSVGRRHDGGAG
jgi:hypothetical protein